MVKSVSVLAALFALAVPVVANAATHAAKPLKLIYREQQAAVAPGSTGVVFDRCPAAAPHGISGYFEAANPPGPFLLGLSAPTPHGWADGVINSANTTQSFFGGEVCSSRSFPSYSSPIVLNPGQAGGYTERCPGRDPKPISGFAFPMNGAAPGDVIVAESAPKGRAWITVLRNLGAQPQTYEIGVFCAPRTQRVVLISTGVDTVAPHQIDMPKGRCPREAPHAIGGLFSPAGNTTWGDIALATSVPLDPAKRVWGNIVTNLTSQPQHDLIGTVCLG